MLDTQILLLLLRLHNAYHAWDFQKSFIEAAKLLQFQSEKGLGDVNIRINAWNGEYQSD